MTATAILWVLTLAAVVLTVVRARRFAAPLFGSPAAGRQGDARARLAGVFQAVGLHRKLLKRPLSGVLHALILSSFLVLFTAIVQAFGSVLFPGFSMDRIGGQSWIGLLQDLFGGLMLVGVAMACWQRYVIRPARFKGSSGRDALVIYLLIVLIVSSMLAEAAFAIVGGAPAEWRPLASALARVVGDTEQPGHSIAYWVHIAAILCFLIYIPGSKHRHMFLAAPNIFWRDLGPKGLSPDPPGVQGFAEFDWKQKLDLLSCTECGRCQDACPAHAAGLPLNPKLLITGLRDAMAEPSQSHLPIVGNVIAAETLWACTTCRACMEACPVEIEHLPKIIDLRRTLVEDGTVSAGMRDAFTNLTRSGNSMGKPAKMRARWAKDLPFTIKDARKEPVDVLWFVGDYASYDPRAQQVTAKVAALFHAADLDFGILYDAERNSGNDVRRSGEEGLFESLARANIEALSSARFKRIVTTDPHSLNALRNEYGAFGMRYDIQHYTTLLAGLLTEGRLGFATGTGGRATFHDPCYLGRYNGEFDAPRRLIAAAGYALHEMPRCRENSFCCGAGGGRIWQDDTGVTERPSENRIREALALGDATTFVVSCPKDKVMYSAAIDALGVADRITVRDIAELFNPVAGASPPSGATETILGQMAHSTGEFP